MCDEGEDMPDLNKSDKTKNSGVKYAYLPSSEIETEVNKEKSNDEISSVALEDLMSKLKNL